MIRDRVRRALADDALVDRAAELNRRTVDERLDRDVVGPRVRAFYEGMDVWGRAASAADGSDGVRAGN